MQKILVEYSESQKAFHITTFAERIQNERWCALNGLTSDYRAVAAFDSREEADEFISECRSVLIKQAV